MVLSIQRKQNLKDWLLLLKSVIVLLIYYFWLHFHAGKCQLMQSIFQKENADKALKYRLYRHLPAYEKIIRNLVSFLQKKSRSPEAAPLVARRSGRNSRWPQPAKHPRRARREIPNRPKAPSADGAIPTAKPQGRRPHPITGGRTAAFCVPWYDGAVYGPM